MKATRDQAESIEQAERGRAYVEARLTVGAQVTEILQSETTTAGGIGEVTDRIRALAEAKVRGDEPTIRAAYFELAVAAAASAARLDLKKIVI